MAPRVTLRKIVGSTWIVGPQWREFFRLAGRTPVLRRSLPEELLLSCTSVLFSMHRSRRTSALAIVAWLAPQPGLAQTPSAERAHAAAPCNSELLRQIAELRAEIARLQATVTRSTAVSTGIRAAVGGCVAPAPGGMSGSSRMTEMMEMDRDCQPRVCGCRCARVPAPRRAD